ncbi:hypothetical protein R1flu_020589 [Riccia fluitans]|uniref:Uncharacterized protein n=1 Tax=Riccia fluitans TaxID=41844 RepID=A0ABD1ZP19_9MARC
MAAATAASPIHSYRHGIVDKLPAAVLVILGFTPECSNGRSSIHLWKRVSIESRSQFEANRHLTKPEEISEKIFEGESRHDIAWHYKIPYPRLHNLPVGSCTEKPSRITRPAVEVGDILGPE